MRLILFSLFFFLIKTIGAQDFQTPQTLSFQCSDSHGQQLVSELLVLRVYMASVNYGIVKKIREFHLFNDAKNWMQMDKFGHSFSCYHVTRGLHALFMDWTRKESLLLSVELASTYDHH